MADIFKIISKYFFFMEGQLDRKCRELLIFIYSGTQ